MPEQSEIIRSRILSNDYADVIYYYDLPIERVKSEYADYYPLFADFQYAILTTGRQGKSLTQIYSNYSAIPKLYTLLDTVSLEASGIPQVWNQPQLSYTGKGILLGFIDTGIDYRSPAFRNMNGTTRIKGIWDQNIQTGTPPPNLYYGSYYREEDINQALFSVNPLDIVPSMDEHGHGTMMAGIAGGTPDPSGSFSGAAFESEFLVVKLKPAKEYLRQAFLIPDGAVAFQETDLMLGLRFLLETARQLGMPIVISFGLGTNQGGHDGLSPLDNMLSSLSMLPGLYTIVAAGNETGMGHHFSGKVSAAGAYQDVELLVNEPSNGFVMELWPQQASDLFAVGVTSPLGEVVEPLAPRLQNIQNVEFLLERTTMQITTELSEQISGGQFIQIRMVNPTEGVWRFRVVSRTFLNGVFHLWLPITGFIEPGIRFLEPDPYTTLTVPACAASVITVSTYNAYDGSIWLHSSRGYTRLGYIKPDLAAPGVDVTAPTLTNTYRAYTGSSVACALAAGASALMVQWGTGRRNTRLFSSNELKSLFYLGAKRSPGEDYPNQIWGFGRLQVYGIFETILSS